MNETAISDRAASFTESVIRDMTRQAMEHDAINLAQGFPDFSAPAEVKDAARRAIAEDVNQYAVTWGAPSFRQAIAAKYERFYEMKIDPEVEICVTCGSTEAMISSMLGIINPGDEVIVFEPFYENYGPDAVLAGAVPRYVTLHEPEWTFDDYRAGTCVHKPHPRHHRQFPQQPHRQGVLPQRARDTGWSLPAIWGRCVHR